MVNRLGFGLAALLAAGLAQPGAAQDLVLPSEVAASHWKTEYQNEFAEKVKEKTGGAIDVKVFPGGQLYNEQDALAALGTGAVQMVWPVSVRVENIVPQAGVINLPFAVSDEMMTNPCFAGGITELLSSYLEPRGIKALALLRTADLFFITKDDELKSIEDLEGKKIRVTGGRVFLDTMRRLGVSPVSMAASEMSTALSQGAIDGVFSSPAGWAEMIGMTGRYALYIPGFSLSTYAVVVDGLWFDGLPAEQQEAITSAINEIAAEEWVEAKAADEKLIQSMIDQGATFHTVEGEELARWRTLADESAASFRDQHPDVVQKIDALEQSCGVAG